MPIFVRWLCSRAQQDPAIGAHAKGCVDNLSRSLGLTAASLTRSAQHILAQILSASVPDGERNSCKPLLAQFALLTVDHLGGADNAWLASIRDARTTY